MDVIDPSSYTRDSVKAFLLANDVPPGDAKYEPIQYDAEAKEIHWTRYVRDGSGQFMFGANFILTDRMVTPVKDGQEPEHHLVGGPRKVGAVMAKSIANIKATILVQIGAGEPIAVGHVALPLHGELKAGPDAGMTAIHLDSASFTAASDDFAAKLKAFLETL